MSLIEITNNPELLKQISLETFHTWGNPLNLEQYLDFGSEISAIFENGGYPCRVFGLQVDDVIVSSCEVLIRPLYLGFNKYGKDYGVATVYTPELFRKKGYAATLLNKVVEMFNSDPQPHQLSLWSDVGDYYSRFGFRYLTGLQDNLTLVIDPQEHDYKLSGNVRLLTRDDMPAIVKKHREILINIADSFEGRCQVIPPELAMYESLQARVNIQQRMKNEELTKVFGAEINSDGNSSSWISWTYLLNYKKVFVLGIFGTDKEVAELLVVMLTQCASMGLHLELFESTLLPHQSLNNIRGELSNFKIKSEIVSRSSSQPMFIGKEWICAGGYAWY